MAVTRAARICLNGHMISLEYLEVRNKSKFCFHCGEKTITHCENCGAQIRAVFRQEFFPLEHGNVGEMRGYFNPNFCPNCGQAYPWTWRAINSVVEIVQTEVKLSDAEIDQIKTDLTELTKDSPKAKPAALRFKELMKKMGEGTVQSVREIATQVLTEAAKRTIWGA